MTYPQDPYGQQQPPHYQQPAYPTVDQYGRPLSDKTKLVAGLLQLFLGHFGVGRFYTGHTGMALAQLFTCGGCGIWALIDGIMILTSNDVTDAEGRILRQQ
ncbi:MAG TPA: TM2 domain-containing protein [Stackebrandtia sp.]|jgi:TM2 domain-containing membrane protein YozV|uniref:TM2 domain-containing protein n=1 Tax=Stackebrandtia sp. TaxID=2023065 RepID=UPI002D67776B|nr:TM2 domain-containing protein [Stackebrandtia sp.]HZE39997.1 TM2 domain-containing protein [Stackebrandtia sp.]